VLFCSIILKIWAVGFAVHLITKMHKIIFEDVEIFVPIHGALDDVNGFNIFQQKHAQTIKLPPPCLTVGARQSRLNRTDLIFPTCLAHEPSQNWTQHSSDQIIRIECLSVELRRLRHHITRLPAFNIEINEFLTASLDMK
jgi:hypothetical protein